MPLDGAIRQEAIAPYIWNVANTYCNVGLPFPA